MRRIEVERMDAQVSGEQEGRRKEESNHKGDEEEQEIEEEEVCRAVKAMRKDKAAGKDGIQMEAYIYGGTTIREGVVDLMKQIWGENRIPEEWKSSIIIPIYKKGDQERRENYRGIALMCTAYKIYTEILRNRLEKIVEEKDLLPESQTEFRKGRGTMDNIFILNHIVQR